MTGVMKHVAATSRFTAAPPSAYPPLRSPIPEYTVTEQILPFSANKKLQRKNEEFINKNGSQTPFKPQSKNLAPIFNNQVIPSQFASTLKNSTAGGNNDTEDMRWQKTNTTQFGKVEEYVSGTH